MQRRTAVSPPSPDPIASYAPVIGLPLRNIVTTVRKAPAQDVADNSIHLVNATHLSVGIPALGESVRHALQTNYYDRNCHARIDSGEAHVRAEQVYAGYGDYRVKPVPVGRQIPIFRLKPR